MDLNNRLIIFILIVALIFSLVVTISFGSTAISIENIVLVLQKGLLGDSKNLSDVMLPVFDIVWLLRMPRIILASCIGAGLSVCGVIMQAIVRNPLADPYILGVSSGASLGATAAILLGVGVAWGENFVGIAAFVGAFGVSLLVMFIANIGGRANSVKLLLAGMALSAVCSAFASFIVYFANNIEGMQSITYWLMGSMAGANWDLLKIIVPLTIIVVMFFCTQYRILNLMLLGDETAVTLGRDLHWYRQGYLLVSSVVVGFAVYAAGMIGFVGLIVPHVVRMLTGTDHKHLVAVSALSGSIFLVWADVLCRVIIPRTELPIGILISLIGAPCFVYLMVKKTYGFGGN